jgi:hypothetical protein
MTESNVLAKMAIEKKKMIEELIARFLGHHPTKEDLKEFKIMHGLNESQIYYKTVLIGTAKADTTDYDSLI